MSTTSSAVRLRSTEKRGSGSGHSRRRARQPSAALWWASASLGIGPRLLLCEPGVVENREEAQFVELQVLHSRRLERDVVVVVHRQEVGLAHDGFLDRGQQREPLLRVGLGRLLVQQTIQV